VTSKRPEPSAEQVAAEELVRRAREQGRYVRIFDEEDATDSCTVGS
jgi:hypothetical protein